MTRHTFKPLLVGFLVVSAGLISGCGAGSYSTSGEKVYPVKGKVLLASGKPLSGGKVSFLPKKEPGLPSTGKIASDGSFTLTTADGREGAAEGDYKVRIDPDETLYSKKAGTAKLKNLPFPASYMDEDGDTGLTASVKPSDNQLEPFKLVPKPKN